MEMRVQEWRASSSMIRQIVSTLRMRPMNRSTSDRPSFLIRDEDSLKQMLQSSRWEVTNTSRLWCKKSKVEAVSNLPKIWPCIKTIQQSKRRPGTASSSTSLLTRPIPKRKSRQPMLTHTCPSGAISSTWFQAKPSERSKQSNLIRARSTSNASFLCHLQSITTAISAAQSIFSQWEHRHTASILTSCRAMRLNTNLQGQLMGQTQTSSAQWSRTTSVPNRYKMSTNHRKAPSQTPRINLYPEPQSTAALN